MWCSVVRGLRRPLLLLLLLPLLRRLLLRLLPFLGRFLSLILSLVRRFLPLLVSLLRCFFALLLTLGCCLLSLLLTLGCRFLALRLTLSCVFLSLLVTLVGRCLLLLLPFRRILFSAGILRLRRAARLVLVRPRSFAIRARLSRIVLPMGPLNIGMWLRATMLTVLTGLSMRFRSSVIVAMSTTVSTAVATVMSICVPGLCAAVRVVTGTTMSI